MEPRSQILAPKNINHNIKDEEFRYVLYWSNQFCRLNMVLLMVQVLQENKRKNLALGGKTS
jgi:hypothetical protein